uniref:F-box domain-containing protein n=1 Tax=Mycena chlorophos TaxID=658473 RepID=A0ABQ0LPD3_MYCCL|nr:predicted protein [Mycena chlorophos]
MSLCDASPFSAHLNTNYGPDENEAAAIRAYLSSPTARLRAVEEQLATIDKLVRERDALREHIDAHNALLAPIRRMPPDIMRHIFRECLPTTRNSAMTCIEAPLLLGRVCSAWRALAYSSPILWSRIHIALPKQPLLHRERLQAVSWWLDKSGACPLSISVYCLDSAEDLFKVLRPLSPRWEHIRIQSPSAQLLPLFVPLSFDSVPLLRSFGVAEPEGESQDTLALQVHNMQNMVNNIQVMVNTVQTTVNHLFTQLQALNPPLVAGGVAAGGAQQAAQNPGSSPATLWHLAGITRAPNLVRLAIASTSFQAMDLPVNWSQLTELCLEKFWAPTSEELITSLNVLALLDRCPNLRRFAVLVQDPLTPLVLDGVTSVVHTNLHTFQIRYTTSPDADPRSPTPFQTLGPLLQLPNLSAFELSGDRTTELYPKVFLRDNFLVHASVLHSLSVDFQTYIFSNFVRMLEHLPDTLRVLRLPRRNGSATNTAPDPQLLHSALAALTVPNDAASNVYVLPQLEVFAAHRMERRSLLRLIESRISVLKHVSVDSLVLDDDVTPEELGRLDAFANGEVEGLVVELDRGKRQAQVLSPWEGLSDAQRFV